MKSLKHVFDDSDTLVLDDGETDFSLLFLTSIARVFEINEEYCLVHVFEFTVHYICKNYHRIYVRT